MLEPISSAVSIMANAAGIHGWFTGLHSGQDQRRLLDEVSRMRLAVERLTDNILYVPSLKEVKDVTLSRRKELEERKLIVDLLTPVQGALREEIVTSAVVATPERLRAAFAKDPWEVLYSIRPLGKVKRPTDPDVIPVIFGEHGLYYVGWQMRGALPGLLDCEYKPALSMQYIISGQDKQEDRTNQQPASVTPKSEAAEEPVRSWRNQLAAFERYHVHLRSLFVVMMLGALMLGTSLPALAAIIVLALLPLGWLIYLLNNRHSR
jgi:hypothetical protein